MHTRHHGVLQRTSPVVTSRASIVALIEGPRLPTDKEDA